MAMFEAASATLTAAGYEHYEVSGEGLDHNFAIQQTVQCRHMRCLELQLPARAHTNRLSLLHAPLHVRAPDPPNYKRLCSWQSACSPGAWQ